MTGMLTGAGLRKASSVRVSIRVSLVEGQRVAQRKHSFRRTSLAVAQRIDVTDTPKERQANPHTQNRQKEKLTNQNQAVRCYLSICPGNTGVPFNSQHVQDKDSREQSRL